MKKNIFNNLFVIIITFIMLSSSLLIIRQDSVKAGSYSGEDLALAMLSDPSTLVSSSYVDTDLEGHRQAIVLSSLGIMLPTNGTTFALLSTGIAGANPVTTNEENPGDERGTWFKNQQGNPRDSVTLTMTLKVPLFMHYLYYDVQFFTTEFPEFVGTKYNDRLTITVNSPSKGSSQFIFDVNNGYFILHSNDIPGTGFDVFAQSGNPANVDIVDTTPRTPGADAGASDLIPIGGQLHPVSPNEQINVTIYLVDVGDNEFDSAVFLDNLRFSGYAKTDISSRKSVTDLNGGEVECNDILKYEVYITNTGAAIQGNNPGNEFEDYIPDNTSYVAGSATCDSGSINYDPANNKIFWNGYISGESAVKLEFNVKVNSSLTNGAQIFNQGNVYWDTDEDRVNDAIELTDDMYVDDGIDQDGDGNTNDDDPNILTVYAFDYPAYVIEPFSDDTAPGNATQLYLGRKWFETNTIILNGVFEVTSCYHYSTAQSFKTQIRQTDGTKSWYYHLSNMETAKLQYWQIWFACGDASESYELNINFKDNTNKDIVKLKFSTVSVPENPPMDNLFELYYWNPLNGWCKLSSDFDYGYLRNSWYSLKIEKNINGNLNYSLGRTYRGTSDFEVSGPLSGSLSDLAKIEWSSPSEPIACPMFFWDEHKIGLTYT